MNSLVTASSQEISLIRNTIVKLNAEYKQAKTKEERYILRIRISAWLEHYQELTKPHISHEQQVGI